MIEITVSSFSDLFRLFEKDNGYVYRGVNKEKHELIPKVGRNWKYGPLHLKHIEKNMLKRFRAEALLLLNVKPTNTLEWLMLAQHHGMSTRLLDWTQSPLVATYFSCEKDHSENSAIYSFKPVTISILDELYDPFEIDKPCLLRPAHVSLRITAQSALFTIHPDPTKPFYYDDMRKIIISSSIRKEMFRKLGVYGIHAASLFPGIDGLAQRIERETLADRDATAEAIITTLKNINQHGKPTGLNI